MRITVSEKPRVLNFDSLLESRSTKPLKAVAIKRRSNLTRETSLTREAGKTPVRTLAKENISKQVAVQKGKAASRSISKKAQQSNAITSHEDTHKEELAPAQLADEGKSGSTDVKTSRTYLWVGFMLMVVGVILGILFGKTALLISIAGMVFVIIGYSI